MKLENMQVENILEAEPAEAGICILIYFINTIIS